MFVLTPGVKAQPQEQGQPQPQQQQQQQQQPDQPLQPTEQLAGLPASLKVYVTSMDPRSYAGVSTSGKTWRNVAPATATAKQVGCAISGGGSQQTDMDFHFVQTPTFSPTGGMSLGENKIAGPLSHTLGIDGDGSFTITMLFQPTGHAPALDVVTAFQIFANASAGNNGFALTFGRGAALVSSSPSASGSKKTAPQQQPPQSADGLTTSEVFLQVGTASPVQCASPTRFDLGRRYLLAATRDKGSMSVSLVDIDAKGYAKQLLLSGAVPAPTQRVSLANVDMAINGGGNWSANVLAVGVYASALGDSELGELYTHYTATLREHDPVYQAGKAQAELARQATACPFDASTCAACGGVTDWSAASPSIITSGGQSCLSSIDRFCTANPQHPRCSCWDSSSPEYGRGCVAYRAVFSGKTHDCPAVPAVAHATPPHAPPGPSIDLGSLLTPANVDAVTKLIGAMRGDDSRQHPPQQHPPQQHQHPPQQHQHRGRRRIMPSSREDDDDASSSSSDSDGDDYGSRGRKKVKAPGFWAWLFGRKSG